MTARQPQVGDRYRAPWGAYAVHRVELERVVLRDLDNPRAYVVPTPAKLAAEYELVEAAQRAPGAAMAQGAAELQPAAPAPASAKPVPPWLTGAPLTCSDCQRPCRALWYTEDDDGPRYCSSCLMGPARPAAVPTLGTWRPPAGEAYASRADVGSYDPLPPGSAPIATQAPARTKPATERQTTRDLWAEISAAVPR